MSSTVFGVLLNEERCAYSYALADALEARAARSGIALEYFPVSWATVTSEVSPADLDEVLARAEGVAGLVMVSSVFSHGLKSLAKFAQLWWPRPASSIGYRLPLVPSVLVDNRGAMQAAANHLISDHGRTRLLFIRGRTDSQEANDRYFGFRQALNEAQIISDGSRVLQGDFTRKSAVSAWSQLDTDIEFDGLIASNDEMALGVMGELEKKGVRIPEDVAIIGFDDVPAAAKTKTPLTTMAQPFDALANLGIELVLEQSQGGQVAPVTTVPVDFVPRASCGCRRSSGPRPRKAP